LLTEKNSTFIVLVCRRIAPHPLPLGESLRISLRKILATHIATATLSTLAINDVNTESDAIGSEQQLSLKACTTISIRSLCLLLE